MPDIYLNNLDGIPYGNDAGRPSNPATGQPYFNGESSRLELYTSATGWQNIVQETPAVVSITGQLNETTSSTIQINGTNFAAGATAYVVGTNGIETSATTTTLVSVVEITAVFPALSPAYAPYDVKVVNPSNLYGVLYETLSVNDSPVWSTAAGTLGTFTELSSVSVTVAATDASDATNSPLVYSVVSGSLPGGLTLNSSTGVISGIATNIGTTTTYSFTIGVTDSRNLVVSRSFSITITDRGPTWSTAETLPTFTRNSSYSTTLASTSDDSQSISYSLVSGSLPTGLALSSAGVISGTPTSSLAVIFTVRATESSGSFSDRQFTMPNSIPAWSTASGALTAAVLNSAYSFQLSATDDSGSLTYSVSSGALPTGLSLSSSGLISGTPTVYNASGSSFTVNATDNNNVSTQRSFSIAVLQYQYATYTSSGTFTPSTSQTVDYLIVAGGGSGGSRGSDWPGNGGGGAGGMLTGTYAVTAGSNYSIVVGSGGSGGSGNLSNDGSSSSAFGLAASGGGGGGTPTLNNYYGRSGGSGGGGTYNAAGGTGVSGQGNNGGSGNTGNPASGGGGGGKGSAGNTWSNPTGGSGSSWIDGNTYAGGGAGGPASSNSGSSWSGGSGGGGSTGASATYYGGGGGAAYASGSGSGYQGIVKIRYLG